jgi:hypothetical protein
VQTLWATNYLAHDPSAVDQTTDLGLAQMPRGRGLSL